MRSSQEEPVRQTLFRLNNEGKSAASFCHQLAALVPDMYYNFYLVKNCKSAKDIITTKAREKISADMESLEF
jgi:hypothetical protein